MIVIKGKPNLENFPSRHFIDDGLGNWIIFRKVIFKGQKYMLFVERQESGKITKALATDGEFGDYTANSSWLNVA